VTTSCITKISLDRNPLGDDGVIKLSVFLGQIDLQELSLMSVGMSNKGAIHLFKNLAKKFTIRKLNVSSTEGAIKNKITAEGVEHLN
jgi:purine-nucleoside phosphorylase